MTEEEIQSKITDEHRAQIGLKGEPTKVIVEVEASPIGP